MRRSTKAFPAAGARGKGYTMPSRSKLVFGGNGRLAGALRRYLPDDTRYAARESADPRCMSVGDYGAVSANLFGGVDTVINVAGITSGTPYALQRANVDAPVHLAKLARGAGVQRFVHVSSFSILGRAQYIDAATPPAPNSEYGWSKLTAEEALLALATPDFAVVLVRLPAIVGEGARDKLRRLIALWLTVRRLPVPRAPVERSMISIEFAAHVLAAVADGDERGVLYAADPQPFTYCKAAAVISAAIGRRVGIVKLPNSIVRLLERAVPNLFTSLYAPSVLNPTDNCANFLPSDLYHTIARLAQQEKSV